MPRSEGGDISEMLRGSDTSVPAPTPRPLRSRPTLNTERCPPRSTSCSADKPDSHDPGLSCGEVVRQESVEVEMVQEGGEDEDAADEAYGVAEEGGGQAGHDGGEVQTPV
ncbi:hypothetical protein LTR16_004541 [Cryomyces antarcticus]|uniref:Uncharacterized protein n=1 Tax=Cryomyces antarcticus TaxID=329879 RepID=A0ABR0KTN5_9PEZI|nr:hypothetical protein LTR39_004754 [Cryomyces antarcticus]KAK5012789.1 hypothetical protein LTR60_004200 [Cryomyces antarcticus]KAK5120608.1 hypothetical protein LTR16_004541 [Cryomyces antarcticus]